MRSQLRDVEVEADRRRLDTGVAPWRQLPARSRDFFSDFFALLPNGVKLLSASVYLFFCGGVCAANTPGTGCWQSTSCEPCPTPEHGSPTCTEEGTCDFGCVDGYNLIDGQCLCASECCTSLDCSGGNVCAGGTCQPPPCYPLECLGTCFLSLQCGGLCFGTTCTCFPCQ